MLISIIRLDNPKQTAARKVNAEAHAKYVQEKLPANALFSGPLYGQDGKSIIGCMFIAEFKSVDGARLFHKGDPYKQAGIFKQVFITPAK